jgi:hypothetical protein
MSNTINSVDQSLSDFWRYDIVATTWTLLANTGDASVPGPRAVFFTSLSFLFINYYLRMLNIGHWEAICGFLAAVMPTIIYLTIYGCTSMR